MARSKGNKLFIDFIKQCGFEGDEAEDILLESASVSLDLSDEIGDRPDVNVCKIIIGICLVNLGIDGTLTDWGWQGDGDETSLVDERLRNQLTSYILKRHFGAIRDRYKDLKFGEVK